MDVPKELLHLLFQHTHTKEDHTEQAKPREKEEICLYFDVIVIRKEDERMTRRHRGTSNKTI